MLLDIYVLMAKIYTYHFQFSVHAKCYYLQQLNYEMKIFDVIVTFIGNFISHKEFL
jgi:hypothetical protein